MAVPNPHPSCLTCWHDRLLVYVAYAGAILDNQQMRQRLSVQEQQYANKFFVILGRHLKNTVLDDLPLNYRSLVSSVVYIATAPYIDECLMAVSAVLSLAYLCMPSLPGQTCSGLPAYMCSCAL